jgi:hypothetical protein
MKELKTKEIDFNNKDVTGTEWYFSFSKKDRPENWTIKDEIMLLSLYLQKDIIAHECGQPIHTLMDWRQNVSRVINKTLDKLEDEHIFKNIRLKNWQDFYPTYESYCNRLNINGDTLLVYALSSDGGYVLTDKGYEESEKDKLYRQAVIEAKEELLREQEQAQKEKEAIQKEVVVPLIDYGK